ncbi:MAG TPA: AI-2E family transporter [Candidatus Dormibacteraeota bacterium]|nr:AI-2E family transporter [Candidatus Dormibacteraeota bacterium]
MQRAIARATWRRVAWGSAIVVLAALAVIFAAHIPRTMSIFLIAAFIAFGVEPIVVHLQLRRVPKPLAISIVFLCLLGIIVVGVMVIVPLTINQVQGLAASIPTYVSTLQAWLTTLQESLQEHLPALHIPSTSFDLGQLGTQRLSALATGTISSVGSILVSTATGFFVAFSSIVLSFFFLLNDSQITDGFAAMFPESRRSTARNLAAEITQVFGSYISGQVIVSAITGVVVGTLCALIGFKLWLILGIITFVGYSIPVIGMLIVQVIALILCAPQGGWMILWVQVITFGMARVSDNILVPKIMGDSVGVSPIGVMFAVFAGGELFGVPGLLLGIPAAALVKLLWRYFVSPWLHAQLDKR